VENRVRTSRVHRLHWNVAIAAAQQQFHEIRGLEGESASEERF
jgi:hypothetical protein